MQTKDFNKSCEQLEEELAQLGKNLKRWKETQDLLVKI
jgi:hypothetical protein